MLARSIRGRSRGSRECWRDVAGRRSDVVCRNPGWIITIWLVAAGVVGVFSPDLTRLAAEGQARMLASGAESRRAAELVRQSWPDQAYESMVVAVLHRPGGLTGGRPAITPGDCRNGSRPAGRPGEVLRVLGPASAPEIAQRLVSPDGTVALVAVSLSTSFVAPVTHEAVAWIERQAEVGRAGRPAGLEVRWTGDAVIGRDYMANVKTSLDRAAVATVVLLLIVLLAVYRSFWLALVPLATIGISLVISRGILAWMILAGLGDLAAGRAVPDRDLVRHRDGLLFVSFLAVCRAFQSEQSGRLDAGDAGPIVRGRW